MSGFWVIDAETDPFEAGRIPKPFIWGVYNGERFWHFPDFAAVLDCLHANQAERVYAHNGGRFDFWLSGVLEHVDELTSPLIINGRLAEIRIEGISFRDSYSLVPVALAEYQKDSIDYSWFSVGNRESHMAEILAYLRTDCVALYRLLIEFQDRFGSAAYTIAQVAKAEAIRLCGEDFPICTKEIDSFVRPAYHGGRCQAFKRGYFKRAELWDLNSAYPWACSYEHFWPERLSAVRGDPGSINGKTLYEVSCDSYGTLPVRRKSGLEFPHEYARYLVFGWELKRGVEAGEVKDLHIVRAYEGNRKVSFEPFVAHYYRQKQAARLQGRKADFIFAKILLNSLYGKLGINPARYQRYMLIDPAYISAHIEVGAHDNWTFDGTLGNWALLARPYSDKEMHFASVMTAGSITSLVRARLADAMAKVRRSGEVLYCDTDSIFSLGESGLREGERLGDWRRELVDEIYIAGPKVYAYRKGRRWVCKSAGLQLSVAEIRDAAFGKPVDWESMVPTWTPGRLAPAFRRVRLNQPS